MCRETATRVRTLSGSVYVLQGAMDARAAAAAGVAPDVARRFRQGFPADFRALVSGRGVINWLIN